MWWKPNHIKTYTFKWTKISCMAWATWSCSTHPLIAMERSGSLNFVLKLQNHPQVRLHPLHLHHLFHLHVYQKRFLHSTNQFSTSCPKLEKAKLQDFCWTRPCLTGNCYCIAEILHSAFCKTRSLDGDFDRALNTIAQWCTKLLEHIAQALFHETGHRSLYGAWFMVIGTSTKAAGPLKHCARKWCSLTWWYYNTSQQMWACF